MIPEQTKTSVAMIGCGEWGKNIARNLAQLGVLRSICETDTDLAEAIAKELDTEFTSDIDAVLSRADIPAVAIATPAVTHVTVASKALTAGKHVFVEKPIALSVEEAKRLAAMASARNLTLMTGHLLQYHPVFAALKSLVMSGRLGKPLYIYSNRLNLGRVRSEENALWSLAPHDISMIIALAGARPARVFAQGLAAVQPGIPDLATATFEFPGGLKAHLFCSWLNAYKEHRLVVIGDRAMAVFNDTAAAWEDKLVLYPHHIAWNGTLPQFVKAPGERIVVEKAEPLRREIEHFLSCVAGSPCATGPDEAIPVLEVLAAAQESMDRTAQIELQTEHP